MRFRQFATIAGIAFGLVAASPAAAQERLPLAEGETYVHPHSEIEVPASLGGFLRSTAASYADDQLDIGINFEKADRSQVLSLYIFRNTNGSVPLWFAQAQAALESQDVYDNPALVTGPEAFALPGGDAASALRVIYEAGRGNGMRSTGIALFSIGEWYVKIRASSATRSPDALGHWMDTAIAELGLPAHNAIAVSPIDDCEDRLRFRGRSRDVKENRAGTALNSLFGSVLQLAARENRAVNDTPPPVWCRDSVFAPTQIVYRANGSENGYLLALGDNGNALSVGPDTLAAILADGDADEVDANFTVQFIMAGRTYNFVTQDRLPSPQRIMQLLDENRIVGSFSTWGNGSTIEINSDAL